MDSDTSVKDGTESDTSDSPGEDSPFESIECEGCGRDITWDAESTSYVMINCPDCGHSNRVPEDKK